MHTAEMKLAKGFNPVTQGLQSRAHLIVARLSRQAVRLVHDVVVAENLAIWDTRGLPWVLKPAVGSTGVTSGSACLIDAKGMPPGRRQAAASAATARRSSPSSAFRHFSSIPHALIALHQ